MSDEYPEESVELGTELEGKVPDDIQFADRVLAAANEHIDLWDGDDYANSFIESMTGHISRRGRKLNISPAQMDYLKRLATKMEEEGRGNSNETWTCE